MRVLDSSFLIALFIENDLHHAKAFAAGEADSKASESWLLSDLILFETLSVIRYDQGAPAAKIALDSLLSNRQVSVYQFNSSERQSLLELFLSSPYSISVADASVAYLCQQMRAPALTYDENLLKVIAKQNLKA